MNIGKVAKLSGLNSKTIRYYEDINLLVPSSRSANGYRQYSEHDLEQLQFIQRARKAGFSIDECRKLLSFLKDTGRQSQEVRSFVLHKAEELSEQIQELQLTHQYLLKLAEQCPANEAPHCTILDELGKSSEPLTAKEH